MNTTVLQLGDVAGAWMAVLPGAAVLPVPATSTMLEQVLTWCTLPVPPPYAEAVMEAWAEGHLTWRWLWEETAVLKDLPPERVKPIPLQLIRHAVEANQHGELQRVIANLLIIGLFFLLCPGEHTYDCENNHPFWLQDVSFQSAIVAAVNACLATPSEMSAADHIHLCFTDQKNGEKGEALTHGDTTNTVIWSSSRIVLMYRAILAVLEAPINLASVLAKCYGAQGGLQKQGLCSQWNFRCSQSTWALYSFLHYCC